MIILHLFHFLTSNLILFALLSDHLLMGFDCSGSAYLLDLIFGGLCFNMLVLSLFVGVRLLIMRGFRISLALCISMLK